MVIAVKNPLATAGDVRDTGPIPGSGRSLGGGCGKPVQYSYPENPRQNVVRLVDTEPFWIQS